MKPIAEYISLPGAARLKNIQAQKLRQYIHAGTAPPFIKLGNAFGFLKEDLDSWTPPESHLHEYNESALTRVRSTERGRVLDKRQAASFIGVGSQTPDRWRKAGAGPPWYRVGIKGSVVYLREEILAWAKEAGRTIPGEKP